LGWYFTPDKTGRQKLRQFFLTEVRSITFKRDVNSLRDNENNYNQQQYATMRLITEDELVERLKISRGTAINHRKNGLLPFVKLGHAIRYHWPTVRESLLRRQREVSA